MSALDVSVGAQVINLLRDLQQRYGLTCLFISHSMPLVRYLCHRVAVMQRGRIVESGTWSEVCDSPREAYTQQLLAATPELPALELRSPELPPCFSTSTSQRCADNPTSTFPLRGHRST